MTETATLPSTKTCRVYMAGPMRGLPEYNKEAFTWYEKELKKAGLEVFNPHAFDEQRGIDEHTELTPQLMREIFLTDMQEIAQCDAVFLLPGYETSVGATCEVWAAHWLGIPVFAWNSSDQLYPEDSGLSPRTPNWRSLRLELMRYDWPEGRERAGVMVNGEPITSLDGQAIKELFKFKADYRQERTEELETAGVKDDSGKARFDLIPPGALFELAELFEMGARKYADRNWEKGMSWGRVFAALCRHLWRWWGGQTRDPQDGQHHLSSVIWCAMVLREYESRNIGTDDRGPAAWQSNA